MTAIRVPADDLKAFAKAIMLAHGVDVAQAESVSEIMLWSDLIGRSNYGVLRLNIHMKRLKHGVLKCPCTPVFKQASNAIEILDADGGFGHHAGRLAMDRAIELAHDNGIGLVCVRNSNFFGAGAYYVNQAAKKKMIGLAMSNSFPKVTSFGGRKPVLGTNPIAFAAPRRNGFHMMLDMSTAQVAGSTVRELIRKEKPLPEGIAIDASGRPITDPNLVASGVLLPMDGAKGFGLALMIEILSGVISGAGISHEVMSVYNNFQESGNNGHFMMAIDINRLMPTEIFFDRMEMLVAIIKGSGAGNETRLPGEKRWNNYKHNMVAGVQLEDKTRELLLEISRPHAIVPPWPTDPY